MGLLASQIPLWSGLQLWIHVYLDVCLELRPLIPTRRVNMASQIKKVLFCWEGGDGGVRDSLYLDIFATWKGNAPRVWHTLLVPASL